MEKLMALYNISSPSGKEGKIAGFIIGELRRMGIPFRQDRYGNIYAVKGNRESYPCVVAHMDEVHRRKTGSYAAHLVADSMIVGYDHKRKRMTGIGADDKNGIWICLKCLEDFKAVKCAFFVQEEIGCIGSGHADMSFFSDCRFVIQCDRKGNGDMVTQINGMRLCSNEFISAVDPRKYGYKPAQGLATDVAALKRNGLEVSCVNLSCGYYEPHTDNEYTVLADLCKCYRFVRHIICCHKETSTHIPETERKPFPGYYELFGPAGYSEKDYIRLSKECKYSINSLVYWVTYVHNVVYSFYRSMIYCYINSTQRCAGSIVIDIIPTNGADKRKFFPFAPYFPVTNVIKRYFYPYFPAIIGIKGYSFPYFPYLSGIMKIKTALYFLFSRLDWHKTVVFPCLGEIYEGIRSLSWEIPVT